MLFALGLLAQTSGSSGQMSSPPSGTSSSQNPNQPAGSNGTWQENAPGTAGQSQSGQIGSQPNSTEPSSQTGTATENQQTAGMGQGHARTVEGCVVREETDYFLIPRKGQPLRLSGSAGQNLSQYQGQRVKAHGTEAPATGSSASAEGTAGTSGMAGATSTETNPSSQTGAVGSNAGAASSQQGQASETNPSSQTGAVGSNAGAANSQQGQASEEKGETTENPSAGAQSSMGQTGATSGASATGNQLHQSATKEITVDRITTVSETCPSNWNPTYSGAASQSPSSQK